MTMTEQLAEDLTVVINHVLRDEQRLYGVQATSDPDRAHARLAVRVAEARLSNPQEAATVMGWVLMGLRWTARHRPLSDPALSCLEARVRRAERRRRCRTR
jgi:hypothetical protein